MKCEYCSQEFESKRADARFCSDKCRKAYKRKADKVSEIINADGSMTVEQHDEMLRGSGETDQPKTTVDESLGGGAVIAYEPGPLDVYSEQRWAFLQSRGHVWDADRQRSTRSGPHGTQIIGVTVPGDPAYDGVAA